MARVYGIGRTFAKGKGGIPARVEDADLIRDSLFQLLTTGQRERVMRPLFGTRVQDLVFESQGPVLNSLISREIRRVVQQHEPRVEILDIIITEQDTAVIVDITYRALGLEDSIQVPFEGNVNG